MRSYKILFKGLLTSDKHSNKLPDAGNLFVKRSFTRSFDYKADLFIWISITLSQIDGPVCKKSKNKQIKGAAKSRCLTIWSRIWLLNLNLKKKILLWNLIMNNVEIMNCGTCDFFTKIIFCNVNFCFAEKSQI